MRIFCFMMFLSGIHRLDSAIMHAYFVKLPIYAFKAIKISGF